MEKRLSVIVVSYGVNDKLLACLDSLLNCFNQDDFFEVVIVDNHPLGVACDTLSSRYPNFSFHKSKINGGFGYGCNIGASLAKGEFLLFLNPDTIVSVDSLEMLVETSEKYPSCRVISCRQVTMSGKESKAIAEFPSPTNITGLIRSIRRLVIGERNFLTSKDGAMIFPDWVSGSVIFMRRDDFLQIGGFDDRFWMYYEDVDLCRRVADNGGKIAFLTKPSIIHNHGGSSRQNILTTKITKSEVKISRHLYVSKHFSGYRLYLTQFYLIVNNVLETAFILPFGLLLFMFRPVNIHAAVQLRLMAFYLSVIKTGKWVSSRSVQNSRFCE